MSTLLLTRTDVQHSMDALTLLEDMREALRARALQGADDGARQAVQVQAAPHPGAHVRVSFPGTVPGLAAYSVTLQTRAQTGGTSGTRGVVHLHDRASGALLAVLDAGHLSGLGLGVVGALAADVLARPDASRVALLGAGPAASQQLKSLRLVRSLQHVRVYDEVPVRAVEFAARAYKALNLPVRPAVSVEEAVEDADIVLIAAPLAAPVLFPGMLRAGTHVTAVAPEGLAQSGLAPGLLRQSSLFSDHPSACGVPGEDLAFGDLGEVLAGQSKGRTEASQVTVFGALGPPWQDLVAAWHVYLGARGDEAARRVDFEA